MMEAIQDLSMEAGEMQAVVSALRRVRERIQEVSKMHLERILEEIYKGGGKR